MQRGAALVVVVAAILAVLLAVAPPLADASYIEPAHVPVTAWENLSWCPCLSIEYAAAGPGLAAIGPGLAALLGSDGSVYLVGPEGLSLAWGQVGAWGLRQVSWGPRASAVLAAGAYSAGAIVAAPGGARLWLSSAYSRPRLGSLWLDPSSGVLWLVDSAGNLYRALLGGSWKPVAGPATPSSRLNSGIAGVLEVLAERYVEEKALEANPGATLVSSGASVLEPPRILWAGAVYIVGSNYSEPASDAIPIAVAALTEAWAYLVTPSGDLNYTLTVNASAVVLVDLSGGEPAVLGAEPPWGLGGEPLPSMLIGAWDPASSTGVLVAVENESDTIALEVYSVNESLLSPVLRDEPHLEGLAPGGWYAPLLDPSRGAPSIAVAGSGRVYYFSYTSSGPMMQWVSEPYPGTPIEAIAPTPWGVAVATPAGLQMLSLADGSGLWAPPGGVPIPASQLAPLEWGLLASTGGGLVAVTEPSRLVGVLVHAEASGHPLGPGLQVNLTGGGKAYLAATDSRGDALLIVPPGVYTARTLDPLLGPAEALVRAYSDTVYAGLNYNITVVSVTARRGADPLGLLEAGPAVGARGFIASPWGRVEASVGPDGALTASLPGYLAWARGIPVRSDALASYRIHLELEGYEAYDGPIEAAIVLNPLTATLAINVTDSLTGSAAPFNATLTLLSTSHSVTLGGSGILRVEVPLGSYEVRISSKSYRGWSGLVDVSGPLNLSISLERLHSTLKVRVVDGDYGFPVNATLRLQGPQGVLERVLEGGSALLDVPWGTYRVTITYPGYEAWSGTVSLEPGARLDLPVELQPVRYNVSLYILDSLTGEPLSALVEAYIDTPIGRLYLGSWTVNGSAILTLRPWNATLLISARGYEPLTLPATGPGRLLAEMPRVPAVLNVTVVDALFGLPVNATIDLEGPGGYRLSEAAPNGALTVGLPWGDYRLKVSADGFEDAVVNVSLQPGSNAGVLVRMEPSYSNFTLRVVDSLTGEPLSEFNYTLKALTPWGPRILESGQASGEVVLAVPLPWKCIVEVEAKDYRGALLEAVGSGATLRLARLTGTLILEVYDAATRSPVEGATAYLELAGKSIEVVPGEAIAVPWGTYTLVVEAPNYTGFRGPIEVRPGGLTNATVALERLRVPVTLYAIDSLTGMPVDAEVEATAYSNTSGDSVSASGRGWLTLWLRVGEVYTVTVRAAGYEGANLTLAGREGNVTLKLDRALVPVLIEVRDSRTGAPVGGAVVALQSRWYRLNLTTTPTGLALARVPWGSYELIVRAPYFHTLATNITVPPQPRFNVTPYTVSLERIMVELGVTVVDAETNESIPATITLTGPAGRLGPLNTTGHTILLLPAGRYKLVASAPGHANASIDVYLTGSRRVTLRLERLYSRVVVEVYDRATGSLVPSEVIVASTRYGLRELYTAPGGVTSLLLLQGVSYTITVNPLSPYYYPTTVDLVVPVGKPKYVEAIPLERPVYNVTVIAVSHKGRELKGAVITLASRLMRITLASGSSATLPAGSYEAIVEYKGGEYLSKVNVTGPGIVVVRTSAGLLPIKEMALTALASGAAVGAAVYSLTRKRPSAGGEETPPPYEELVGRR